MGISPKSMGFHIEHLHFGMKKDGGWLGILISLCTFLGGAVRNAAWEAKFVDETFPAVTWCRAAAENPRQAIIDRLSIWVFLKP